MASDKTPRQPKLGEAVHVVLTHSGVRSCVAGRIESPVSYTRDQFPVGELGDKMLEQHLSFQAMRVSYVETTTNLNKIVEPCTRNALASNGYHLSEECPYGI